MDEFEYGVLTSLVKKYNDSVVSKGGSCRNLKISLTPKHKALSSYSGRDSFKFIDDNDKKLAALEKRGYIFVRRDKNGALESVDLNISAVEEVIKVCGLDSKSVHLKNILEILQNTPVYGFTVQFVHSEREYVATKYEWHKSYYADEGELSSIIKVLNAMVSQSEEIMERDFSVRVLGDSKAFAHISNKVVAIAKKFDSQLVFEEGDSAEYILQNYNIVKNSTYALIKGNLKFELNGQAIDLNKLGFEYALSDAMIKNIKFLSPSANTLFTVENLTTFYKFKLEDCVVVYLAGFHNHTKQMLLKKLYADCAFKKCYHFGDIDVGGFMIYNNLVRSTSIPFEPYCMGIKQLKEHTYALRPLTSNDKKRLEDMQNDEQYSTFHETISYMLVHDAKLEQEALD